MASASLRPSTNNKLHQQEVVASASMASDATYSTPSCSSTSIRNSILSGYAAGITGTLVGHPLDSAKVWLQTQQTAVPKHSWNTAASSTATSRILYNNNKAAGTTTNARNMSTLAANLTNNTTTGGTANASSLVSRYASTLRALYKGIGGPLVTVGMVQSVNFAVYDSCRRMLYNLDHPQDHNTHGNSNAYLHHDSLYNVAASSMVAGSILACFTSPMLIVKTQQQVHGHSFRRAVQEMIRPDKAAPLQFRNMFVGFGIHSFSEIIGRAVYFVTYEHLKRSLFQYRVRQDPDLLVVNLQDRMASAAVSGILCWAAIFPIDAVRCRLYAERPSVHTSRTRLTAVHMARNMWQQAGWRAFYRGFGVTVLRAGPVAAAVLPVYDLTLETLSGMD
jgi:solute carrier family 25 carnitine/acylcarnitine transporter 20/29